MYKLTFRGVAQLVARMVRDHEAASSSLATSTIKNTQVQYNKYWTFFIWILLPKKNQ